jgi:hypothetical protein
MRPTSSSSCARRARSSAAAVILAATLRMAPGQQALEHESQLCGDAGVLQTADTGAPRSQGSEQGVDAGCEGEDEEMRATTPLSLSE